MTTFLEDSFAHHVWATDRILDACSALTAEQITTPVPGTYGPIIATLRHLGSSDAWYLSFFRADGIAPISEEEVSLDLGALRSAIVVNGALWMDVLAGNLDADKDIVEHGDGWDFHAPTGLRLAQVIQHGNDHRSQVCTALTSFGLTPPEIDLWAYGEATGRTSADDLRAT